MAEAASNEIPECAVCAARSGLKACANCLAAWYCSKEHQREDWKRHKSSCNISASNQVPVQSGVNVASVKENIPEEIIASEQQDDLLDTMESLSLFSKTTDFTDHGDEVISPINSPFMPSPMHSNMDLSSVLNIQSLATHSKSVVKCLHSYGFAVIDKFLGEDLSERIRKEVAMLHSKGSMTDGQTLSSESSQKRYRTDQIIWVTGSECYARNISIIMTALDTMFKYVAEELDSHKIQGRTQAMVACYPGNGSRYVRHVDNPSKDGRLLTCIYYLNQNWNSEEDGGLLKIYPEGMPKSATIAPLLDRLLIFWSSKRNPHEVYPAFRTRYAVTVWYFDAKERSEAIKRQKLSIPTPTS